MSLSNLDPAGYNFFALSVLVPLVPDSVVAAIATGRQTRPQITDATYLAVARAAVRLSVYFGAPTTEVQEDGLVLTWKVDGGEFATKVFDPETRAATWCFIDKSGAGCNGTAIDLSQLTRVALTMTGRART